MNYVLGFLFGNCGETVALIRKTKPEWQAGRLNGIGGKIEKDETPMQAMVREFKEETGILILWDDWKPVATMQFPNAVKVEIFAAEWEAHCHLPILCKTTDESPGYYESRHVVYRNDIVDNLKWLIPMSYWRLKNSEGVVDIWFDKV